MKNKIGYYTTLEYVSKQGDLVRLHNSGTTHGGQRWIYQISTEGKSWWEGGKTKLKALIAASHHAGRSAEKCAWEPL